MAIKKFNSIDGFSVGSDTPIAVIDNVANVSANSLVVANKSNLGNVGNITITGGSSGYVLQTDGSGNLIFVNPSSTGVAGSNTQVQFNNNSSFGSSSNFTFDTASNTLAVTNLSVTTNSNSANVYANYINSSNYYSLAGDLNLYAGSGNSSISLTTTGNGTIDVNDTRITNLSTPQSDNDAATKKYVDDVAQGLNVHDSCKVATTANIATLSGGTVAYNNGASGVGANLVITGGSITTIDTYSLQNLDRILVKNEANLTWNGIYTWATGGTVLTRATDFNTPAEIEGGDFTFVTDGNVYQNTGWVQTDNVTTIGTDSIEWQQFSGAGTYEAGNGLSLTGTVFSVNVDNVTIEINSDVLRVKANAQFITPDIDSATGNSLTLGGSGYIQAGNLVTANYFTGTLTTASQPNITSLGTLSNLSVTGNISSGNISGGNLVTANYFTGIITTTHQPYIESVGNLVGLTVSNVTGIVNFNTTANVSLGDISNLHILGGSSGYVLKTDGTGNLSWGIDTAAAGGSNRDVQFNDGGSLSGNTNFTFDKSTSILTLTGNIITSNANLGNLVTANYFNGDGSLLTNLTGSNVIGNVTSAIQSHYANIANSVAGANVNGNVASAVQSHYANIANSVAGANVSGQVGNALIASTVYTNAQPNITSLGNLTSLIVSGNTTIAGNLTVSGNVNYINVDTLIVQDPIIEMGGGANGAPLTTNDGKDRGSLLHYYTTSPVDAFMGWDNSNAEFSFGSNVSVTNEVVTFNSFGNVRANYFIGDGSLLSNINAANIIGSYSNTNVAAYLPTYTGNVSANYFIGNGATLTFITGSNVSGNVTSAIQSHYANIANSVVGSNVSGNVSDAVHAYYADVANSVSGSNVNGNVSFAVQSHYANIANSVTGANVSGNVNDAIHAYYADVANSISGSNVSGQVGNALIAGTVYTNAQPNITSVGTLSNLSVSGDATITGNLTVSGTTEYINVTNLYVKDPIIEMGGGANGAPLTTDDGKDRGTLLHYYTTSPVDAFMGWDNSNAEFAFGSNVSITNEVVTYSSYGNIRANYFIGDGSLLSNINAANIIGSYSNTNVAAYLPTYTGNLVSLTGAVTTTANITANYFIGNGSQLTGLPESYSNVNVAAYLPTYTGNVSANYFIGNGATLTNITGANIIGNVASAVQSHYANVANSVSGANVSGNVTDAIHAYYADVANSVSGSNVTGNVSYAITSNWANIANSVSGSNVSGNVADAVHAYYADVANSVSGGNVSGQVSNALIAGTVYTNAQPNITSLGTLTELTVDGLTDLGPIGNVTITGGTSGYVLTTNGSGDLSWQAAGGSTGPGFVNITKNSFTGNGVQTIFTLTTIPAGEASLLVNIDGITQQDAAYSLSGSDVTFVSPPLNGEIVEIVSYGSIGIGSNTTVLFNDNGDIGNVANFTFNKSSNTLNVTNITVNGSSDLGSVGNVTITGGTSGYVLTTNGSGDLSWQAAGGSTGPGFVNITKTSFTGNGVQTIFTLTTTPAGEASLLVNIDGITQQDAAYSLSGSNVTFSSPPLSGEIVEIVSYGSISIGSNTTVLFNDNGDIGNVANFTFNKSSNTLNVTNIDTTSISFDAGLITVSGSNAGVFSSGVDNINLGLNANVTIGSTLGNTNVQGNLVAGNISTVGNLVVSNTATITNLKVNDFYSNRTPVSVTTNTIVDSFPTNKYRSAKYTMRVNSDDGYQAVEVLLIHDGIDSYVTIYGSLSTTGTDIVTLFSNINSGNVRLLANSISANTTVNFVGTYVAD